MDNATDSVVVSVAVNAPFMTHATDDEVVFAGDNVEFECRASGIPEPGSCFVNLVWALLNNLVFFYLNSVVTWTFNRTRTHVTGAKYSIARASHAADVGKYVCR